MTRTASWVTRRSSQGLPKPPFIAVISDRPAASVASVTYSSSAQTQTGTVLDRMVIPGNNAVQDFFPNGAGILLPNGSANGVAVFINLTGAANWTVSARWIEF